MSSPYAPGYVEGSNSPPPIYQPGSGNQMAYNTGGYQAQKAPQTQEVQYVVVQQTRPPNHYQHYLGSHSLVLGVLMLLMGLVCAGAHVVLIGFHLGGAKLSYGLWGAGFWLILTGAFGICAGKKKNKCLIITFLVFCIFTTLACLSSFLLSVIFAMGGDELGHKEADLKWNKVQVHLGRERRASTRLVVAMNTVIACCSMFGVILSLWSMALGCKVCCCRSSSTPNEGRVAMTPGSASSQAYR